MKACVLSFACVLLLSLFCCSQSNGVPSDLVRQIFYVKTNEGTGTGFVIEYKQKQFLITAKHVVQGLPSKNAKIQVFRSEEWKDYSADILTPANKEVDIAVLELRVPLVTTYWPTELSPGLVNLGGQVYFLGFPHGLHSILQTEYVPFVKAGVLSGLDGSDSTAVVMYIDGFNNPGFSGGPVVAFDNEHQHWKIIGVIQGYYPEAARTRVGKEDVDTKILMNSGILVAYSIKHALETIDSAALAH